jgi:protein SCO1
MQARPSSNMWWLAALVVAGGGLFGPRPAAAANPWGAEYFPNVELTTQDGKVVHFYDDLIKGKSVVVNLIYTHCTNTCPLETAKLRQVQKILGDKVGKDIFFYSITLDPKRDTPEVLKAYMEKFHVAPGWTFLTGKPEDIKVLAKKLGLSSINDNFTNDGHLPTMMMGNEPSGQWMRNSAVDNPRFLAITMSNFFHLKIPLPTQSYASLQQLPKIDQGAALFKSQCAACHTIGGGEGIGPDLANVTKRRDRRWVTRYITEPDKVLNEKDPVAVELFKKYKNVRMPNLSNGPDEVAGLIDYIEKQSQALAAQKASAQAEKAPSPGSSPAGTP